MDEDIEKRIRLLEAKVSFISSLLAITVGCLAGDIIFRWLF